MSRMNQRWCFKCVAEVKIVQLELYGDNQLVTYIKVCCQSAIKLMLKKRAKHAKVNSSIYAKIKLAIWKHFYYLAIPLIKAQAVNIRKVNWHRIPQNTDVLIMCFDTQLDEQWSFIGSKKNQRWQWVALCQYTTQILAFTFGKRTNQSC